MAQPGSITTACPQCATRNRIPAAASGTPRCGSCRAKLPWLVSATDADFTEIAERSPVPVLVDLWAAWCAPCRMVAPAVERASQELVGRLKVVKVDVDGAPGVAARFDARSIPTLLVLRDGQIVARQVGALPPDALLAWARRSIA
jgi:thioredoxin 2